LPFFLRVLEENEENEENERERREEKTKRKPNAQRHNITAEIVQEERIKIKIKMTRIFRY
jgi:hypothetical protein